MPKLCTDMPRVQAVLDHPVFISAVQEIEQAERNREFCRHGLAHLLDVARIMWIYVLESNLDIDRELVYATALLHDLGRAEQYASGVAHEVASVRLAQTILSDLDESVSFSALETNELLCAIESHRGSQSRRVYTALECVGHSHAAGDRLSANGCSLEELEPNDLVPCATLADLLRRADKASRACYACPAQEQCYWPEHRKNHSIVV